MWPILYYAVLYTCFRGHQISSLNLREETKLKITLKALLSQRPLSGLLIQFRTHLRKAKLLRLGVLQQYPNTFT